VPQPRHAIALRTPSVRPPPLHLTRLRQGGNSSPPQNDPTQFPTPCAGSSAQHDLRASAPFNPINASCTSARYRLLALRREGRRFTRATSYFVPHPRHAIALRTAGLRPAPFGFQFSVGARHAVPAPASSSQNASSSSQTACSFFFSHRTSIREGIHPLRRRITPIPHHLRSLIRATSDCVSQPRRAIALRTAGLRPALFLFATAPRHSP